MLSSSSFEIMASENWMSEIWKDMVDGTKIGTPSLWSVTKTARFSEILKEVLKSDCTLEYGCPEYFFNISTAFNAVFRVAIFPDCWFSYSFLEPYRVPIKAPIAVVSNVTIVEIILSSFRRRRTCLAFNF